jgi:hypothetical protein
VDADTDVRAIAVIRIRAADSNPEPKIRRDVPVIGGGRQTPQKSGAEGRNEQRAHDRPLNFGRIPPWYRRYPPNLNAS